MQIRTFLSLCLFMLLASFYAHAAGPHSVVVTWSIPDTKENGDPLRPDEIAGYEIEYKLKTATLYASNLDMTPTLTTMTIDNLAAGEYDFRVRVFDVYGDPSEWVNVDVDVKGSPPSGVKSLSAERLSKMPAAIKRCYEDVNCTVTTAGKWGGPE